MERFDEEIESEKSEEEAKELTPKTIRGDQIEKITRLQDEQIARIPMEKLLAYIKKKYDAEHIENLTEEQGDDVISELNHIKEKYAKKEETVKQEQEQEQKQTKEIDIEWDKIPPHVLSPKLERALNYIIIGTDDAFFKAIKKKEGGTIHHTSLKSCDCEDWKHRGNSLNPCVHQLRIRYTDDEINETIKKNHFEEKNTQAQKGQRKEPSVFSGISQLQPRLCETGKIKIGELSDKKTASGRRLPRKLDHFVVTTLLRDEEGDLLLDEEMSEKIGDDCRELDIFLCYDSPELNMPTFYAYFSQSKLHCMGDGKTALRTKEDGGKEEITCNPKTCEVYKKKLCKPYGRLSVILSQANRIGGAYVFRTTSWNTLRNVLSSMSFIKAMTRGILAGLPLKMRLIPMQVQPQDLGYNVKIFTVNIEFAGTMGELNEAAEQEVKRRMQLGTNMKQIEAEDREVIAERVREEAEEQAVEIAEEFASKEEAE